MKIYCITSYVGKGGFALLHSSNEQYIKEVDILDVWWDDWCSVEIKSVILCFVGYKRL